jgi:hypothetical protein
MLFAMMVIMALATTIITALEVGWLTRINIQPCRAARSS